MSDVVVKTQDDYLHAARANLLAAIGAATGGAVDEEHEEAILDAIERLIVESGNEALVAKAEAYVRVQRLIEAETGRLDAIETKRLYRGLCGKPDCGPNCEVCA